ncbi:dystroglycan 1-like [Littorina saxatilis]|uniref:dystroglycan 1-like n=1 Tax=Littorina saxatilis TaxID=31220 RepID=UPI0038B45865
MMEKRTAVCVVVVMLVGYVSAMDVVQVNDNNMVDDSEAVALMWGIADTTAAVGRMFSYHIPADAFQGKVSKYEVVEAGKDKLPSWLHFAPDIKVLKGIPTPTDAGQLYLEVVAHGSNGKKANDVFSVFVSADTQVMSSGQPLKFKKSGPEVVRCKREEPETVATIVVDADLDGLTVEQRLELMGKFLGHMGLGEEMMKMVPAKARLLQDDTALVTGTGDAAEPQHSGVAMSWLVGCGKVEAGHFPVLQKLDDDSGNGAMGKALGHPISGWRVTNSRLQQHALKRKRRQVRATPTPVVTISPPTATDTAEETTDADTMTHKVVDMASPTFSIEPTPSQPIMPKTTTPTMAATTPKMEKPDVIQPSKPPVTPSEATKTAALPTDIPTTPKDTKPMPPVETTTKKPMDKKCRQPEVNVAIAKQTFFVGEVIDFKIPEDAFNACGMGTSVTFLNLFRNTSSKIEDNWFLQFNENTQTLRGMAMEEQMGTYAMTLVARTSVDPPGRITTMPLKFVIRKPKGRKSKVNHEVSMTIDTDYDAFVGSLDKKLELANKVAGVFGDENASALRVTRIARGSVVYAFTNQTLAGSNCPVDDLKAMADKLVTKDGQLNPEAVMKLKPYVLTGAATQPAGDCEGNSEFPLRSAMAPTVQSGTTPAVMPDSTPKPMDKTAAPIMPKTTTAPSNVTGVATAGKTSEDDIWITTVVPAVVIVAILLIALLIACILYRKKRKGKMNLEDQNTFVNKGAPVIFPDELDDKPSDSSKPLLLEGSPPAPPPEYHVRQPSESPEPAYPKENTPPTDEAEADIETDATSPLYQPPPPVTASSGKQARPHVQQPYRSQPQRSTPRTPPPSFPFPSPLPSPNR